eukprot:4255876-Amphidinium_carterae.1
MSWTLEDIPLEMEQNQVHLHRLAAEVDASIVLDTLSSVSRADTAKRARIMIELPTVASKKAELLLTALEKENRIAHNRRLWRRPSHIRT